MKKIRAFFNEFWFLVKEHKLYFLMPLMVLFALVAVLFFHYGPTLLISFIYAGV